ncbi:uncharacterized protein [Eurosta solidaginis]|uniref:uncharacterized protein n=1 Tax=Eurosta solidaginis TaxID=178769 RepID=UPI0035309418
MSYDMCLTRGCNVCFLLLNEKLKKVSTPSDIEPQDYNQSQNLHKCSGCQLIYYCSPAHQRLDWPIHRRFCRAANLIMTTYKIKHPYLVSGQPNDANTMERATIQVKYLMRQNMARPLEFHEEELTSFPAHCEICYKFDRIQSSPCCFGVSYCSAEHAAQDNERHRKQCNFLKLYYCPYKVRPQVAPEVIIKGFYKAVQDLRTMDLVDAFEHITGLKLPEVPISSFDNYQLFACAGDFSCMGSILFTLSFTNLAECTNRKFVIFIVGAVMEESLWFRQIHTKWFFLQHPNIIRLEMHFIGPQAPKGLEEREITYEFLDAERTVLYASYAMLFETFSRDYNVKPSLIAAFNCGFSEYAPDSLDERQVYHRGVEIVKKDTWYRGILEILQTYDVPILFTSLTQIEAELDYGALLRVISKDHLPTEITPLFLVKINPYRDLRPLRNWQTLQDQIYYRNNYIQAVVASIKQ